MKPKTIQRLIVEDYCKMPKYAGWRDLTLAKRIFEENKDKFKDVEKARQIVRTIRGHKGQFHRDKIADKSLIKPLTHDTTNWQPFKEEVNTSAKVLILDIETAPIMAYVWNIWNQNVGTQMIKSDWFCLTWAAKWLFEDKVYSGKLTPKEARKQDDKRIIKGIWAMINEADIVIAHNGDKFDIPKLNQRFIIHKLNPPLPYQSIDTLKHIRRQFGFTSNKLDYVNQLLSLPRKTEHEGFPLWERCMAGNEAALNIMEDYNVGDVKILEDTYLRIRSWIKPHPNLGLFILDETESHCPTCGHTDLKEEGKPYVTSANRYTQFRCGNCGATGKKRLNDVTVKQRRNLLMSIPK
jgi:DNA polymerase elongation subunit (family B)